ncbi:hypothetical protein AQJ91_09250 [Streptomyces dysideae]|uniref:Uncharacterized protein n=1 Tax=Streptomyces dysideae TaxID=909626 RepID=A0A124IFH7_9ACTN|nr:hypothetical protein AQJ91_09250 [Streptomyces dysideae]
MVRQYDARIEASKAAIERHTEAAEKHRAAAGKETEKCELLIADREEALSLVGVGSRLRAMQERAMKHGILTSMQTSPPVTLHIVPDPREGETSMPDSEPPASGEPTPPPPAAEGQSVPEIIIRSRKRQQVLNVIASRPDLPWGSEDIAKVLGIPRNPKDRKSLRNCLQALTVAGALERVTREDDPHVYYRPRMNWKFA